MGELGRGARLRRLVSPWATTTVRCAASGSIRLRIADPTTASRGVRGRSSTRDRSAAGRPSTTTSSTRGPSPGRAGRRLSSSRRRRRSRFRAAASSRRDPGSRAPRWPRAATSRAAVPHWRTPARVPDYRHPDADSRRRRRAPLPPRSSITGARRSIRRRRHVEIPTSAPASRSRADCRPTPTAATQHAPPGCPDRRRRTRAWPLRTRAGGRTATRPTPRPPPCRRGASGRRRTSQVRAPATRGLAIAATRPPPPRAVQVRLARPVVGTPCRARRRSRHQRPAATPVPPRRAAPLRRADRAAAAGRQRAQRCHGDGDEATATLIPAWLTTSSASPVAPPSPCCSCSRPGWARSAACSSLPVTTSRRSRRSTTTRPIPSRASTTSRARSSESSRPSAAWSSRYDQISPLLRQAIVSAEDQSFEDHFGLSIPRIIVTAVKDVVHQEWCRREHADPAARAEPVPHQGEDVGPEVQGTRSHDADREALHQA